MTTKLTGKIQGIGLPAVLQLLETEEATCAIKISAGRKKGHLFLEDGDLIAAQAGDLTNKEAVFEILYWDNIVIEVLKKKMLYLPEIETPLMSILMEGLSVKDEKNALKKKDAKKYTKAIMKRLEDIDPKSFRKTLDSMGLARSNKIRLSLSKIFRDRHDADLLISTVEEEAKKIYEPEDRELLIKLLQKDHEKFMKSLMLFLFKWVQHYA